eukprot:7073551-Pyramimonas_sp.AAC.1
MDVLLAVCTPMCMYTYMSAFMSAPIVSKGCHIYTTLPQHVHNQFEKKIPNISATKSERSAHFYGKRKAGTVAEEIYEPTFRDAVFNAWNDARKG